MSLLALAGAFTFQLTSGIRVVAHPEDDGAVNTIAVLVIVCFLIGIDRAWALIGGPTVGVGDELAGLLKDTGHQTQTGGKHSQVPPE
ncbi:MAG: hypothetical protein M3Y49_04495 [Actinomycetota bacterium]|nr:hypothetical protein [Actinomycetota bacterium]